MIYKVPFNVTLLAADGNIDIVSVQPADDKPCRIAGWSLGQTNLVGDAAEKAIRLTIRHLAATVTIGTGGAAVTPVPPHPGVDPAAGFTARVNDGAIATSSGNDTVCEERAWNLRASPYDVWIPEDQRAKARQGEALILRNETTLAGNVNLNGTVFIEEL